MSLVRTYTRSRPQRMVERRSEDVADCLSDHGVQNNYKGKGKLMSEELRPRPAPRPRKDPRPKFQFTVGLSLFCTADVSSPDEYI